MSISDRITELRENAGLNMTALAKRVDVTTSAVSNWEAGNTTPRPAALQKLASVLGTTTNYLLTGNQPAISEAGETVPPAEQAGAKLNEVSSLGGRDVAEILDHAKQALAQAMGVPVDAIQLEMNLVFKR